MKKSIAVLGSTGSVGRSALDVIRNHPSELSVCGLSCGSNTGLLMEQAMEFRPRLVAVADPFKAGELARKFRASGIRTAVFSGEDGLANVATAREAGMVVGALSGIESLVPVLKAIRAGKDIALANKELIVGFGRMLMREAKKRNVRILPLDSELSAIFQCLEGSRRSEVEKIILTASGGPFYGMPESRLAGIKVRDALRHPVWKMGRKITVDSATLMNKGLEIIETSVFFGVEQEKIEVLIHPGSIVHSMVRFTDGVTIAQLSKPDMRIPIQYALFYPRRTKGYFPAMDLADVGELKFRRPDLRKFPCPEYARRALEMGGCAPAVLSASDEVAVEAFIAGKIGFRDIPETLNKILNKYMSNCKLQIVNCKSKNHNESLKELMDADRWARQETTGLIERAGTKGLKC